MICQQTVAQCKSCFMCRISQMSLFWQPFSFTLLFMSFRHRPSGHVPAYGPMSPNLPPSLGYLMICCIYTIRPTWHSFLDADFLQIIWKNIGKCMFAICFVIPWLYTDFNISVDKHPVAEHEKHEKLISNIYILHEKLISNMIKKTQIIQKNFTLLTISDTILASSPMVSATASTFLYHSVIIMP